MIDAFHYETKSFPYGNPCFKEHKALVKLKNVCFWVIGATVFEHLPLIPFRLAYLLQMSYFCIDNIFFKCVISDN